MENQRAMHESRQADNARLPITYEVLKQELTDSGRPYDFDMIERA